MSHAGQLEDAVSAVENGDFKKEYDLLQPLAEQGNLEAQTRLGALYINGQGVGPNACLEWLENAGKIGHDNSLKLHTKIYSEGLYGIPSDEEKATYWHNLQAAFATGIDGR